MARLLRSYGVSHLGQPILAEAAPPVVTTLSVNCLQPDRLARRFHRQPPFYNSAPYVPPAATFIAPPISVNCVSPDRLAHRQRRQPPVPGLGSPIVLRTFAATRVPPIRTQPRPIHSRLAGPVVVNQPPLSNPVQVNTHGRIRPPRIHSSLPLVIVPTAAQAFYGPTVYCVSPDRLAHRYRRVTQSTTLGPPTNLQTFSSTVTPKPVRTRPRGRVTRLSPPVWILYPFIPRPVQARLLPVVSRIRRLPRHSFYTRPGPFAPSVTSEIRGSFASLARNARPRKRIAFIGHPVVVSYPPITTFLQTRVATRPRRTHSSLPTVIVAVVAQVYYGPSVKLVTSRPRRTHSALAPPTVLQTFQAARPTLARTRPRHVLSKLSPPATLEPFAVELREETITTRLVRTRPRHTISKLSPPTVVRVPSVEQLEQTIETKLARTRPRPTRTALRRPTVLQVFAAGATHLVRTRPRHTVAKLAPPVVIRTPSVEQREQTISITLVRIRPRPTTRVLGEPTTLQVFGELTTPFVRTRPRGRITFLNSPQVVNPPTPFAPITVTQVRIRPRHARTFLSAPSVVTAVVQVFYGVPPKLVQARPRRTHSFLQPPATLQPYAVTLAEDTILVKRVRTRPRPTTKFLGEPTALQTFEAPAAPLVRTRPRATTSFLNPPTVVRVPSVEQLEETITTKLVRTRPRPQRADLQPPTVLRVFTGPEVTLVKTRPRPTHARVIPPTKVRVPSVEQAQQTIEVKLARIRPRKTRTFLRPPVVVAQAAAARETTIRTTLVTTRPAPTASILRPPATLEPYSVQLAEDTIRTKLVRTRPARTHARLQPPTVLTPFVVVLAQDTIRVKLVRARPPKTHARFITPAFPLQVPSVEQRRRTITTRLVATRPRHTTALLLPLPITRTFAAGQPHLARIRPARTHSTLRPPTVVTAAFVAEPISLVITHIRPRPTVSFVAPPTVLRVTDTILTSLVRIRPAKTHARIEPPTVVAPAVQPVVTQILVKLQAIPDRLRRHLYEHLLPTFIGPKRLPQGTGVTEGYDIAGAFVHGDDDPTTNADGDDMPGSATTSDVFTDGTEGYDMPATGADGETRPL